MGLVGWGGVGWGGVFAKAVRRSRRNILFRNPYTHTHKRRTTLPRAWICTGPLFPAPPRNTARQISSHPRPLPPYNCPPNILISTPHSRKTAHLISSYPRPSPYKCPPDILVCPPHPCRTAHQISAYPVKLPTKYHHIPASPRKTALQIFSRLPVKLPTK